MNVQHAAKGIFAKRAGKKLTIFAGDVKSLGSIRAQLKPGGEGQVMFIVATAGLFGWVLIYLRVPDALIAALTAHIISVFFYW